MLDNASLEIPFSPWPHLSLRNMFKQSPENAKDIDTYNAVVWQAVYIRSSIVS